MFFLCGRAGAIFTQKCSPDHHPSSTARGPLSRVHASDTKKRSPPHLIFFLGRSWLVWPHFFLRQLVARGCRRA